MKRALYVVDAFTGKRFDGNQAGVVPDAEGLEEVQMQQIAREVNASETAFVLPAEDCDIHLRFFTPLCEVPFCGHAFVASLHQLHRFGEIELQGDFARLEVKTGAGIIGASLKKEGTGVTVEMVQVPPAFREVTQPADLVMKALGTNAQPGPLPLELSYTGLWTLVVQLPDVESLLALEPDFRLLAELNDQQGAIVTMAFAKEGEGYRTRGFAPAAGVDEDPVTGSASGALCAYLMRNGQLEPERPVLLHQRPAKGRGGQVTVSAGGTPEAPERITVSGTAVTTISGEVELDDV